MSTATAIEWTDATWNPVTGCDQVSAGCDNCYALTLAKRLKSMGNPRYQSDGRPETSGPGFGVTLHTDKLDEPLSWKKPRRVFVNSMSDLFHPAIPQGFIFRVFDTMENTPQHTYQILTKRPARMRSIVRHMSEARGHGYIEPSETWPWPLPNVWLGVSVEDQEHADKRIPALLDTPAAVRFLSCEPLLGPIDLSKYLWENERRENGILTFDESRFTWVIVGGESGLNARPMNPEWARSLREQCDGNGVAFFFKQWGGRTPKANGRELDGRAWDEMPLHSKETE